MSSNNDLLAKILLVGETGAGKTCIHQRYCQICFCCRDNCTIGVEFKMRIIQVDEKKIKLQIWDTAGQERFGSMTQTYYKGAMGVILCYAINNRESFEKIGYWMEEIRKYASNEVCIALTATKNDLSDERVVSIDEGRQLAEAHGMKFFETSAKKNLNIDEVFMTLARDIMKVDEEKKSATNKLQLGEKNSEEKNGLSKCF